MGSDRALSSKARALFSSHLDYEAYQGMAGLPTVQSIAIYLHSQSRYEVVLRDVLAEDVHRDTLEERIRTMVYWEYKSLLRYSHTKFHPYFIIKQEIQLILYVANALLGNLNFTMPQFYLDIDGGLSIDVAQLKDIKTYEDLLSFLETTHYRGVLSGRKSILEVEHALSHYYSIAIKQWAGRNQGLKRLLSMDGELKMVEKIYRLKKFYHQSHSEILSLLAYDPCLIPIKEMKHWIDTYDSEGFLQAFRNSSYRKYLQGISFETIEHGFDSIRYQWMLHHLRFSQNSEVVFLAYMELLQFEMKNIVDVIEGVRYGLPQDEIMNLLIL